MRIVYHLIEFDPDLVLNAHLASIVGSPSIQTAISHEGNCRTRTRFYLLYCQLLFLFQILEVFVSYGSAAALRAAISENSVLPASPKIDLALPVNCKVELVAGGDSLYFDILEIFHQLRMMNRILTAVTQGTRIGDKPVHEFVFSGSTVTESID